MAQKSITSFFTSKIVKTDEKQELKCSVNDKSPASDANASKKRLHSGSDTDEGNKIRKKEDIKQNSTNVNKSAVKKSIKKKTDIVISPGLKPGIAKILLKQYEKSPSNHSDESNSGNENSVTEIKCQKKEKEVKKRRRIINPIDSSSEDEANSKQDKNDNKSCKNDLSKDVTSSDKSVGNTVLKEVNVQIEENANFELKLNQGIKEEKHKEKVEEEQSENNVQKKSIENTQEKDECIDSDSNVSSVLSKSQNGCGKTESKIKNFFAPKQSKTVEKKGKEKLSPKSKKELDSPSKNGKESDSSPKSRKESNSPHKSRKESVSPPKNIKLSNDSTKNGQYNPSVSNYNPIDNASWKVGEKTPYSALSRTLEEIENISARLKIIEILSNYFRSVIVLSPDDLLPSVYLCLNKLAPAYEGLELGIAEVTLMKAIAQSTGRTVSQIKKNAQEVGDLGIVAEQSRSNQRMMFQPARLTVKSVYDKLKEIAKMTGTASVSKKVDKIQSMFVACQQAEARYLIRSLAGKLRIGLAEQSVLQALALACTMTPPGQEYPPADINVSTKMGADTFKTKYDEASLIIKTTYCECPNYDKIIPVLLQHGVKNLPEHCKLTPGIPLKPMLAHPTKGVQEVLTRFENLKFTCEWKYDGERAQIHILENGTINIYSRNQEDNTSKYPDIISRIPNTKQSSVSSCILDCEAVAWDLEKKQILPFQILSTRKRKDASEDDIKVRVCVFMFDLLYLNGESLVKKPLIERRKLLHEHFQEKEGEWCFATSLDTNTMEEVQDFLEESVKGNCEGLMIKTLEKDATYEIAKRSRNWLKLKKDYLEGIGDTLDLVVLGGYLGKGKRTGTYGGFLLFCFHSDTETYESVCKIGTGFSDEDLQKHTEFFKEHVIPEPKSYYQYDTSSEPDHWFNPVQVWEVKCADFSLSPVYRAAIGIADPEKGISLRFPRFIRVRDDKSVEEASSSFHIADMYSNQSQIKNQQGTKNEEEDFYFM